MIRPSALPPEPRVALIAPAGPLSDEAIDRALGRVRDWGWEPVLGAHARGRHGYLAAPDAERAADLNAAIHSDAVDAIWCLRGGYGAMRILDRVDWAALARRPRPLVGFSDVTALHLALQRRGVVSFHGPHPAAEQFPPTAERLLRDLLTRPEPLGILPFPPTAPRAETLVAGRAEGPLVGGNLVLVAATLGTPYAIRARGAILFLEDVGEPTYRIDRLLSQLLLARVFDEAAGVVLGGFTACPDEGVDGGPSVAEVLRDRLGRLRIPVATGFPFGHIPDNWTLPLGVRARLDADAGTLELLEAAVR